ncbi:uncharacterized protein [Ptychodera flava]
MAAGRSGSFSLQIDYPSVGAVTQQPVSTPEWEKEVHDQLKGFSVLVEESQDQSGQLDVQEITKNHWVNNSERSECVNPNCKKKFSLTERKHHCRSCGEVYCWSCTSYERRLSALAEPDPAGKRYKVCFRCYDQGPQTIGQIRDHSQEFLRLRLLKKIPQKSPEHALAMDHYNLPLNVRTECKRLVDGFQHSIGNSKLKSTVSEIMSPLTSVPDWQKCRRWTPKSATDVCQRCKQVFGWTSKKYSCKVCGCVVCSSCSSTDLLLFVPDGDTGMDPLPRWAIIRLIGCPEVEPDIHLYLRVCNHCKHLLQEVQIQEEKTAYRVQQQFEENNNDTNLHIDHVYRRIVPIQKKIDTQLPEYQKRIDGLEIGLGCPKSLPQVRSNTQILAKAQGDLADHFTSFVCAVMSIKQIKAQTPAQQTVVRNLMKCKFGYYQDNMYLFRQLKHRLAVVTPMEVLERIQQIVDYNAINGACLATKQLAYESLILCMKHKLNEHLAASIKRTSEVMQIELQRCVEEEGENWDSHQTRMETFIKMQLKGAKGDTSGKTKCYIRPSKEKIREEGLGYIEKFLPQRCEQAISKITLQLNAKSMDKNFKASKESLKKLQEKLKKIIDLEDWDNVELSQE